MEQSVESVNMKSKGLNALIKIDIILNILNVVMIIFFAVNVIKPFVEDETTMMQLKEQMTFVWNNGLQIECIDISFDDGAQKSLNDLVSKPLYVPENANVNFRFRLDDYMIAYREGNIISVSSYGIKHYVFNFEDDTTNVHVEYLIFVLLGIVALTLMYFIEMLAIVLVLALIRAIRRSIKNK